MADDKKQLSEDTNTKAAATVATDIYGAGAGLAAKKRSGGARPFKRGDRGRDASRDEFEQRILDIARVTRVMAGGKRMSFRACVAIGDKKGKVAVGVGKGADVTMAVNKAVNRAKKEMITVTTVNDTIAHAVFEIQGAAKILLKPARKGKGVIAGGVTRILLELAGVKNATSKVLGTNNKINNARCTIEALKKLKKVEPKKDTKEARDTKGVKELEESK